VAIFGTAVLLLPVVFVALVVAGGWILSAPGHRGRESDHFDGVSFKNPDRTRPEFVRDSRAFKMIGERRNNDSRWPDFIDDPRNPPPPKRVAAGAMRVTFVNHATMLVQMEGMNVLTDPIWSERCSPFQSIGPKRHRAPGVRFEDLPPIDLVVVSHNHYDHMDVESLRRLAREHRPRIVTGLGNRAYLASKGIVAEELDWWESRAISAGLELAAVPAQHFSGRGLSDRNKTLWCGFVLRSPAGSAYFAGDTAMGSHFEEIGRRFGPIRLAMLPVGAFKPEWFMAPVHIGPREALAAHRLLGARTSVAMHFGTFHLGIDGEAEAANLVRAAGEERFWVLGQGEGRDVPQIESSVRNTFSPGTNHGSLAGLSPTTLKP
jgi:L-ascorbate metabolism protein UlaG (beta-lactamase superfamily)